MNELLMILTIPFKYGKYMCHPQKKNHYVYRKASQTNYIYNYILQYHHIRIIKINFCASLYCNDCGGNIKIAYIEFVIIAGYSQLPWRDMNATPS